MSKVVYEATYGVLHIGEGRFFYANEPVEVDDLEELLSKYSYLKVVEEGDPTEPPEGNPENEPEQHTESSLKKLNAEEQKAIIEDLGGNVEETNNAEERIALILLLQEENQEESE